MKYEITEQQYLDFLNMNAVVTKTARGITSSVSGGKGNVVAFRNTATGDATVAIGSIGYNTPRPHRAVTYLSAHDWLTFLDWIALRPMSELEYEKMCVGPVYSADIAAFPWGGNYPAQINAFSSSLETGAEVVKITGRAVLANFGSVTFTQGDASLGTNYTRGAVRSGIGAIPQGSRGEAGAGYYGVMELAGNVWEFVVTVGDTVGLPFSGLHGDGEITTTGFANVINWPAGCYTTGAAGMCNLAGGVGRRGGSWTTTIGRLYTSDRNNAAFTFNVDLFNLRTNDQGGRGVRSCTNCL
jgi:formylglycine-generating enzyme required for sulfatase activity